LNRADYCSPARTATLKSGISFGIKNGVSYRVQSLARSCIFGTGLPFHKPPPTPRRMEYTIQKVDDVLLLSLKGRLLGEHQTLSLLDEIDEEIATGYVHVAVVMEELDYINSTGLSFLLTLLTRVRKHDGEVVLCCLNDNLQQLMITTKLQAFFRIEKDRASALAHFETEEPFS
jgi:anti-sigma B factor antagonist